MLGLLGSLSAGHSATARPDVVWPDSSLARTKARALIEALNTRLLEAPTATSALEKWCGDHKMASVATIRAKLVSGIEKPISVEQRQRLKISEAEPVKYRRVELSCGDHILSEADNWYVPGRLTAAMNHILATTDTPFGRAVQDLKPFRRTFTVEFLWQPRADGAEPETARTDPPEPGLVIPWPVLRHRALVYSADPAPFAEVHETYTREILGFDPP